ncbi:MAG: Na+/H+ antiporter NhaA [Pirellulales bacterium]
MQTRFFKEFFSSERTAGMVLLFITIAALSLANSSFGPEIEHFLHSKWGDWPVESWVNDALMVLFFLMVGLELKRELFVGELSSLRNAMLPVVAALGGMLVPAAIHAGFNWGTPAQRGAGIPMATDIAFSLGVLSLFGARVPYALKVFLTALAIADDLGAIVVIAIFYTQHLHLGYLAGSLGVLALLFILNRARVRVLAVYLIGGLAMWWLLLHSGVHATLSGVMLAFAIPFDPDPDHCISHRLQHRLHLPIAFGVLPIFAFVNTCIPIEAGWTSHLTEGNSLGIFLGLVVGKPVGILLFCFVAVTLKLGSLAEGITWRNLAGAGMLAGIGFTMSIFVSLLAFEDEGLVNMSQITVLIASLTSAVLGSIWFLFLPSVEASRQ